MEKRNQGPDRTTNLSPRPIPTMKVTLSARHTHKILRSSPAGRIPAKEKNRHAVHARENLPGYCQPSQMQKAATELPKQVALPIGWVNEPKTGSVRRGYPRNARDTN